MDSESKIKSARDILSKKKEQMNVAKILEFIKKCEQISESYDALHKTYIDESTAWSNVCTSLLVCISKTIPFDESIFKELLDDIENIKLDVVSSQAEGRQVEVLEKIKILKILLKNLVRNGANLLVRLVRKKNRTIGLNIGRKAKVLVLRMPVPPQLRLFHIMMNSLLQILPCHFLLYAAMCLGLKQFKQVLQQI